MIGRRIQARPALGCFAILAITLIVYSPAMQAGFVWDDDAMNIVFDEEGLHRVWFTTEQVDYWPVVWTSFWLEHQIWGIDPVGYHVVNVLLHVGSALLTWLILARLGIPGAALAAMIFAVHPVNVESVAWVIQRKNTLCMFFFAVSLSGYLRFDHNSSRWWYGLSIAAFVAAMLSKTGAAPLPVVLLICCWWRHGSIRRLDMLRSVPFFVISVVTGLVQIWFQTHRAIGEHIVRDEQFLQRLAGAGRAVWFYLFKAVLPVNLSFVYPRWHTAVGDWHVFVPGIALVLVAALCWFGWRYGGRAALFALAYVVVTLGPVLGFVDIYFMRYSYVADHYQYFSIIGVLALVVAACRWVVPGQVRVRKRPKGAAILTVLVVLSLSLGTWGRCHVYKNSETLWRDTIARNPRAWMAHLNLGIARRAGGQLDDAVRHYESVLRLKPDSAEAYTNLGNVAKQRSQFAKAIVFYKKALNIDPDATHAHYNMGLALSLLGRLEDSAHHFQLALTDQNAVDVHVQLGRIGTAQGRLAEAISHYEQALEANGGDFDLHTNLGSLLTKAGKIEDALKHFQQAALLRPRAKMPLVAIAWLRATHPDQDIRDPELAVRFAERAATSSQYKDPRVLDTLAAAYAASGRFGDALAIVRKAIVLSETQRNAELVEQLRRRTEVYSQGKTYR